MTDHDRLREEIAHLKTEVEMGDGQIAHLTVQLPDDQVNAIQALIAREVRLGKIEELKYAKNQRIYQGISANPKYAVSSDYITDRIAELSKEDTQ